MMKPSPSGTSSFALIFSFGESQQRRKKDHRLFADADNRQRKSELFNKFNENNKARNENNKTITSNQNIFIKKIKYS